MEERKPSWFYRHQSLCTRSSIGLLLFIVVAEAFLLHLQRAVDRDIQARSDKLLTTFLQRDTVEATSRMVGVPIRLRNVRFKWSNRVYIDAGDMAVRAVPVQGTTVNLDDLDSFLLTLQKSEVRIRPDVLEGMFNESVFNYPGSDLRNLKVTLTEDDGERLVHLTGNVKMMFWMPFKMDARLRVDTVTNTLVIEGKHVKVLGVLPVTKLIKFEPFQLEHMISLPPNKSLLVHANLMMVKPFGLFPPPRINGRMSSVTVEDKVIRLDFAGAPIQAPKSSAKNYVYLKGGTSQFGSFRMLNTDILIVDKDQSDPFVFSILHYKDMIPRSDVVVGDMHSARVSMPDFQDVQPIASAAGARDRSETSDRAIH